MNLKDYVEQSERTERKFPEGMVIKEGVVEALKWYTENLLEIGERLDALKKYVIYGKELPGLMFGGFVIEDDKFEVGIDERRAESLHAMLGIVTEGVELTQALSEFVFDRKRVDVTNIEEEIADMMWYMAILARLFDINIETALDRNIAKLKARYPEKFEADRAINRDTRVERAILEGSEGC